MKKQKIQKERLPKVGDRIWLRVPHNGKIDFVYKNGDIRVELDPIEAGTIMGRFSREDFELVKLDNH